MKPLFQNHDCLSEEEIRGYLEENLSDERRFYVENHLLDCPLCSDAVDGLEELAEAPVLNTQLSVIEPLKVIDFQRSFWMRSAAALALLLVALFGMYQLNGNSDTRLFAEAFESYESDLSAIVQRGDRPTEPNLAGQPALEAGALAFEKKNYQESITAFQEYLEEKPENQLVRFHLGVAQLEVNQLEHAIENLTTVLEQSKAYKREASWHLGLALLKHRERTNAILILEDLIAQGPGRYYEEAKRLHSKL